MRAWLDGRAVKIVALVVAVAAIIGISIELFTPADRKSAVAYLPVAIHLYPGSEVDILGVKIGTITSVTPQGDKVKIVLEYDADRKIPAGAQLVVDEPTLVADRVVELTPPYDGGPVLADDAVIPMARTGVPVELDELSSNLVQLADALGPEGANGNGALSRFLTVMAANLRGQGQRGHTTITRLSQLLTTLGHNRQSMFSTVRNLQAFTDELASHDQETRSFTTDLADVSGQLAAESEAFRTALANLGRSLNDVAGFIHHNRAALAKDVDGLTQVTQILAKERMLLAHMADMGAVGISNYPHMYTPSARTYNARFDNVISDNPTLFFCQLYQSMGGKGCPVKGNPLKRLGLTGDRR
jgi:phospholipid/cholesterol/gamma-HCH transport system substrate-binding protein